MANGTLDWKAEARDLREQGMSEREIAEQVGKAPSSVHEALKEPPANGNGVVDAEQAKRLRDASGITADREAAQATPGQQTIDGREVPPAPEPRPEEIVVRGTTPLDFFNAGGKLPNKASVKFTGGKVGLESGTAFKKGDVIAFEGYATVVSAKPRDKRDRSTGIVVECELQLEAEIDDLRLGGEG